jgi:hypothetical protein
VTFPLTEFSNVSITQVVDARMPKTRYLRSRVEGNRRPYFMVELTTTPLPYAEGMAAAAYMDSLKVGLTVFALPNPLPALATRTGLSSNGINLPESTSITLDGATPSQTNALVGGDFIQYTNHQKVYRLVGNKNANGAGEVTATITPELFSQVNNNEVIQYGENVVFQVCLDDYVSMDVRANNGKFIVFTVTLIEQG